MANVSIVLLLILGSVAIAKEFPPNSRKAISDDQIKDHPKFQPNARHRGVTMIPTAFDARAKWPKCLSIKTIRDQGKCGTCWAVAGTSVLSDRICIASGQEKEDIMISANQAASCTLPAQTPEQNCQEGGDPSEVFKHTSLFGLPTGGAYNSKYGCVPYQPNNQTATPLTCSKECTNADYQTPIDKDQYLVDSYWINYQPKDAVMTPAQIDAAKNQMQIDIMTNGPISASITVYDDFQTWDKTKGAYTGPSSTAINRGGHAIKIIGWDKDEKDVPYWIISNSWGTDVGDNGLYWLQMGKNTIGIERSIGAPIVTMINPCVSSSFLENPIDQAILTDAKNDKSPVFLFQGNCTQQVTVDPKGVLSPVGSASPLSKVFLGAPAGPITGYLFQNGKLWLKNAAGKAGSNCVQAMGSIKFSCGDGTSSGGFSAKATFYSGDTMMQWSYGPEQKGLFNAEGKGMVVDDLFTKFASVNALLNIDGTKMLVFGKDAEGKGISGVLSYPPDSETGFVWVTTPGPLVFREEKS